MTENNFFTTEESLQASATLNNVEHGLIDELILEGMNLDGES